MNNEYLDTLIRLNLADVMVSSLPTGDCWVDTPTKDIPATVLARIRNVPPNVKALTFIPTTRGFDNEIRAACKLKGVIVVWAKPPKFERYLDERTRN